MAAPIADARRRKLEEVLAENELLRREIRTAREAAEISAGLVARQFEQTEALLQRLQAVNAQLEVDIAARKRAEDAVAQEKRQLAAILDGLPDAAFVVDHEQKVIAWNKALAAMTGFTAADMLGKGQGDYAVPFYGERRPILVDLIGMADEEVARRYPVLRREGDVLSGEVAIDVRGQTLYVEARACALRNADGNAVGGIEIIRDLTERKRFEDELAAAREAAEKASQAKADFLANMSHEIRTPMNAIVGMTHLALQTPLDAKQRNYLEKVDAAARNLLGIINDILDFSKIEAGKIAFERIDFDLEELLDNVADLAAIRAQDKGLELLFDVGTDVPTALIGDPLRLSQVLNNLVGNAIKFTEVGEVTVAVRRLDVDDGQVRLRFAVHDTGIGMNGKQCARLFAPFTQADSSTTRRYGGTGLGLSICKRLIEMMDGEIGVESEPGVGSSFLFTARLGLAAAAPPLAAAAAQVPGLRILVVDDNQAARDIFLAMLGALGFAAAAVADAATAFAELERAQAAGEPYGLVLMDWQMPRIDGIEAVRRIQGDAALCATPLCMMVTAYSRDELQARLARERVRVAGLLVKPASPSTLCDGIMTVFGKGAGRRLRRQRRETGSLEARAQLAGARILLVEDNDMNREIALEVLAGAGIGVDAAGNGEEALAMLARNDYDAVLMDCQMPVMDGFEATRRLRADGFKLPVIAMTANAMTGDREKCLAAGMDDHVAKPIDVGQLFAALAHRVKPAAAGGAAAPAAAPAATALPEIAGLDAAAALARLDGDAALYRRMLGWFYAGQADAAARIRAAWAADDREAALRAAHTLKGLAGNLGARELQATAARLERALAARPAALPEAPLAAVAAPLAALVAALGAAGCGADGGEASAPVDAAALTPSLRELARLLADNDMDAVERLAPLAAGLDGAAAANFHAVVAATRRYAFDEARARLREFAAKHDIDLE